MVCAALFFGVLNASAVALVLPSLGEELDASLSALGGVMSVFMLTYGVAIPVYGRLAERYGARRLFIFGLALFGLGSFACALAPSLEALIAARVIQGLGGAAFPGLGMTLASRAYPPERRGFALGMIAATLGVGSAAGPLVGGAIAGWLSWRALFFVSAGATLVIPLALRLLPGQSSDEQPSPWFPFVPAELRRAPLFRRVVAMAIVTSSAYLGAIVGLPLMLAERGLGPIEIGLLISPAAVVTGVLGVVAGRVVDRRGPRAPTSLGALGVVLALVTIGLASRGPSCAALVFILVGAAVSGASYALLNTPMAATLSRELPEHHTTLALSLYSTTSFVGGSVGAAVFVRIVEVHRAGWPQASTTSFAWAFAALAIPMLATFLLARRLPQGAPAPKAA